MATEILPMDNALYNNGETLRYDDGKTIARVRIISGRSDQGIDVYTLEYVSVLRHRGGKRPNVGERFTYSEDRESETGINSLSPLTG